MLACLAKTVGGFFMKASVSIVAHSGRSQYPGKHDPMCFEIDQPTRARNRRVIRRDVFQTDAQKVTQGERVRRAPRNAAFGVDALEIPNQQQAEVDPGGRPGRPIVSA
jgi:hypothetical protein